MHKAPFTLSQQIYCEIITGNMYEYLRMYSLQHFFFLTFWNKRIKYNFFLENILEIIKNLYLEKF